MNDRLPFPDSFPNERETAFLKLIFCSDTEFPALFEGWSREIVFDDVNYATLRLLPLLYMRMSEMGVQGPLFGRIQGVYKLAWVRNQQLLSALCEIEKQCEVRGMRMMVLKGVPLLVGAYKNIGARFLDDADILVDVPDIKKILTMMRDGGWKMAADFFPDSRYFSEESLARIVKGVPFAHDSLTSKIDVHWRLYNALDSRSLDRAVVFEELWNRSATFEVKGRKFRSLSPEDMLLHVIVHGAKSNEHRPLRWVTDAAFIIKNLPVNWNAFIELTKAYGWSVDVRVALSFLLQNKFVSIPEEVAKTIISLPVEEEKTREYYKKANGVRRVFDPYLVLWRIYWKYEAKGLFPFSIYFFLKYLVHAKGFSTRKQFASFAWEKCRTIPGRLVRSFR